MALKDAALKAITGNRLRDGEVVFFQSEGVWVERFEDAILFEGAAADAALATAKAQADRDQYAVDVYAFDVTVTGDTRTPVKTRERIRALGPTVRTDLGKQAAA